MARLNFRQSKAAVVNTTERTKAQSTETMMTALKETTLHSKKAVLKTAVRVRRNLANPSDDVFRPRTITT